IANSEVKSKESNEEEDLNNDMDQYYSDYVCHRNNNIKIDEINDEEEEINQINRINYLENNFNVVQSEEDGTIQIQQLPPNTNVNVMAALDQINNMNQINQINNKPKPNRNTSQKDDDDDLSLEDLGVVEVGDDVFEDFDDKNIPILKNNCVRSKGFAAKLKTNQNSRSLLMSEHMTQPNNEEVNEMPNINNLGDMMEMIQRQLNRDEIVNTGGINTEVIMNSLNSLNSLGNNYDNFNRRSVPYENDNHLDQLDNEEDDEEKKSLGSIEDFNDAPDLKNKKSKMILN
ncbi:MAG: hypothetical protein MJ252_28155, partial [archaeon]|nr:hypothetical protein [archaeon]